MPDNYYTVMTNRELLKLLLNGQYRVCIETGNVFNKKGEQLTPYPNREGHLFVRLYHDGKRKTSAVHRLVWMVATRSTIPKDFEVHHRDVEPASNGFTNLLCLHKLDHRKFHVVPDEVPF